MPKLTQKSFNGDGQSQVDGAVESHIAEGVEDDEAVVNQGLSAQVKRMGANGVYHEGAT